MTDILRYVEEGNLERIRESLRAGGDPNSRNIYGESPLHIIASKRLKTGQDVKNGLKVAEELIRCGADVNTADFEWKTPLMYAVHARNRKMVKFLLENNANINHMDIFSNTATHHAVALRRCSYRVNGKLTPELKIVKTLLKFRPELDLINIIDRTPLIIAVKNQDIQVVDYLLKQNASVNFQNRQIESVMHYALSRIVDVDIVFKLARYGGDFGIRNIKGHTPIDFYINRLSDSTYSDMDDAKKVFKIIILLRNTLRITQYEDIEKISREKNCQLSEFIRYCIKETMKMLRIEFAPKYYIYTMALHGFFKSAPNNHLPFHVFDRVLEALIAGEYPMYWDLIISGICSPYLKHKFAEMCRLDENTDTEFLNFDELYKLSSYLSPIHMFNMILACSPDKSWDQKFPYLGRFRSEMYCYTI